MQDLQLEKEKVFEVSIAEMCWQDGQFSPAILMNSLSPGFEQTACPEILGSPGKFSDTKKEQSQNKLNRVERFLQNACEKDL